MDRDELKVMNKVIKEKYKYHKLWKILAIVFICLTILFATLYFVSGEAFEQTINNNDVEVINNNNGASNNNNNYVTVNN